MTRPKVGHESSLKVVDGQVMLVCICGWRSIATVDAPMVSRTWAYHLRFTSKPPPLVLTDAGIKAGVWIDRGQVGPKGELLTHDEPCFMYRNERWSEDGARRMGWIT